MPPLAAWPTCEAAAPEQEVVELQLLLSRRQAAALEDAARARGMTTGQILRRVIADLFPVNRDGFAR
jgi:hypothetical protein